MDKRRPDRFASALSRTAPRRPWGCADVHTTCTTGARAAKTRSPEPEGTSLWGGCLGGALENTHSSRRPPLLAQFKSALGAPPGCAARAHARPQQECGRKARSGSYLKQPSLPQQISTTGHFVNRYTSPKGVRFVDIRVFVLDAFADELVKMVETHLTFDHAED